MKKLAILTLLIAGLLSASAFWWNRTPAFTDACIETNNDIVICAASDMARYSKSDPITLEHSNYSLGTLDDGSDGRVQLASARNETVGFQLLLRNTGKKAPSNINVALSQWRRTGSNQNASISHQLFHAHYHLVDKGGYTWGPKSDLLPWPAEYPDALVPQQHGCFGQTETLFDSIRVPSEANTNQALWIDSFIPADTQPGNYSLVIDVEVEQTTFPIAVELTVFDATLPEKPSIDAIGEIYRSYNLEGAGWDRDTKAWQDMAHCYQQLAHQHRMVFMERWPDIPSGELLQDYIKTYQPLFDGSLFTTDYGYSGTGQNTPVSVWRTPWPQEYNVKLENPLQPSDFERYEELSRDWRALTDKQGWNNTRFFAYVFDELDGPDKENTDKKTRHNYLSMVHEQMGLLQNALDEGTGDKSLDLLWTSHSNPAQWQDDEKLDLTNKVRLWSPNAMAADPTFLTERIRAGDTAWFYHSGHPAIGAHSVNASGIDMRTWGVIGARYGFGGQFMWAVNLGNDNKPFAEPSYKPDEDRFGNGVVVYPGNQLDKIDFKPSPGPMPSMRLKAWRRGLQDAELFFLARDKNEQAADALIQAMVPQALADGKGDASWPKDVASWIDFKVQLLELASQ